MEHDPHIQYRKEGIFLVTEEGGEWASCLDYQISDLCLRDGITFDWFPENWSFGNGVTIHKTYAGPEYKTVIHGTNLSMDEFLAFNGPIKMAELELIRAHQRTEGWEKYESRWVLGTCPQENHVVHLTWLITTHRLPRFAYERIRALIEGAAEPLNRHLYSSKVGEHFSVIRKYDGKSAHGGTNALPMF